MARSRVALYVDGDNISPKFHAEILGYASSLGELAVARVFANSNVSHRWKKMSNLEVIKVSRGSNMADFSITADAMRVSASGEAEIFVIASSDTDFAFLAGHLRSEGRQVIGLLGHGASRALKSRCDITMRVHKIPKDMALEAPLAPLVLNTPKPKRQSQQGEVQPSNPKSAKVLPKQRKDPAEFLPRETIEEEVLLLFDRFNIGERGLTITAVAALLESEVDIRPAHFPEKNWRKFFEASPDLFDLDEVGAGARMRIVPLEKVAEPDADGSVELSL